MQVAVAHASCCTGVAEHQNELSKPYSKAGQTAQAPSQSSWLRTVRTEVQPKDHRAIADLIAKPESCCRPGQMDVPHLTTNSCRREENWDGKKPGK